MAKKKDQDEIIVDVTEVYSKTEVFIDRNRKILSIVLLSVIGVVALGAAYYYLMVKPANEKANQAIWKAEQYLEIDSVDLALYGDGLYAGLEDVIKEHSGTKAGARGNYQLGIVARDRGEFEEAIKYFEQVDLNDEVVSVLAIAGIGDCQVELGQIEEGAKNFERAAAKTKGTKAESFTGPVMHFKAGIAYLELDQREKAAKHFETIVKDYPESRNVQVAERYAAYLGKK